MVLGACGFLDDLSREIHRRGISSAPDFITLDSADGGSGAEPQLLIDYTGLPLRESLPVLSNKLIEYDLKRCIRIVASGKLVEPAAVTPVDKIKYLVWDKERKIYDTFLL